MNLPKRIAAATGRSLKFKFIFLIVVILAITLGVAPWSAIKVQQRQLLQASEERLQALREMVETTLRLYMLAGKHEMVQNMVEAAGRHQDIERVRILDIHGTVRFSSHPEERGMRISPAELSRYYGKAEPLIVWQGKRVVYTQARPIFARPECAACHPADQKVRGILQLSISLDHPWQDLANLKRSAWLATVIALVVIVAGIWLALSHLVDSPLQQLVAVMKRVQEGDLSARAPVHGGDELGRLAIDLNTMISELQGAQQEIQQYHQEQLARADRLATIGEMAAAIAHEIRNPLTGISGVLSVLSRDFPQDDPRQEIVKQTHQLIERLNRSVEDVLHYSRPSRPHLQMVTVEDVIDSAVSLVGGEANKAQVRLVKSGLAEREDGYVGHTVVVDPQQLQQVIVNLVLNAIQATPAGGEVSVGTRPCKDRSGCVFVEVADNGKGMTPEAAGKAFQPFFSTKAQGTGLGLAIAKQIVEQHEGRISLESAPGQGTRVRIELPADRQAPDQRVNET